MENFKEALIQFSHSNPNLFPNDAGNSYPMFIEECFHRFFPVFQTPNHPPYAAMIYRAIRELNKKGGSSEKSILKYIKKEYADLPWAHSTLLKHHLEKLCDGKEICMTHKQCYLLAGSESESGKKCTGPSKKHKKQKSRLGLEGAKKSCRPHNKFKKKEKHRLGIQEISEMEQVGMRTRKRKRILKSKKKSSKRTRKHAINVNAKLQLLNEANLKQNHEETDDESHEQKQTLEVKEGDTENHEQNVDQELHHDNSGYINMEQIHPKKNPEPLQPEESPRPILILPKNGEGVCTRSRSKTLSNKDKPNVVEHLSNESEPQKISGGPSLEKLFIERLNPISSKLMTRFPDDEMTTGPGGKEVQDLKDQQAEKSTGEVKPKCNRHGRHPSW